MGYEEFPPFAAWQFVDAVNGFEVVYRDASGIRGHISAVEAGQAYRRLDDHRFDYHSEGGFNAVLVYDKYGLVLDYPGIATRFA